MVVFAAGCSRPEAVAVQSPQVAMESLARCADPTLVGAVRADWLEGVIRQDATRDRAAFSVRAGRCEDLLGPSERTHECLRTLRLRWAEMLATVQSPTPDAIALDVAVRRVGDAWTEARTRCP